MVSEPLQQFARGDKTLCVHPETVVAAIFTADAGGGGNAESVLDERMKLVLSSESSSLIEESCDGPPRRQSPGQ